MKNTNQEKIKRILAGAGRCPFDPDVYKYTDLCADRKSKCDQASLGFHRLHDCSSGTALWHSACFPSDKK